MTTTDQMHADIAERFRRDTAKHELTVFHDDGLYRHLRFQTPDRSTYWFELVTWPGRLAITGDVNGYVFSRTDDMFAFFRDSSWKGGINPTYWDEKVVASRDSVMRYSEDLFNQQVAEDLKTAEDDFPGVTEAWDEKVNGFFAEFNTEHEHDARAALNKFEFMPEGETGEPFRFQDTWEWQLRDYHWSFLWCCHAIVWGIGQYDSRRSSFPAPGSLPTPDLTDAIERLNLSPRVNNCLRSGRLRTVVELVAMTEQDVLDIRNSGVKTLAEVKTALAACGLKLRDTQTGGQL